MTEQQSDTAYRVLARKYRPANFKDLIGHDAMVRTLSNALKADRLAHAYVLTGTRGIGKTTTARIIARGLNCTGVDGTGGATIDPCGVYVRIVKWTKLLPADALTGSFQTAQAEYLYGIYHGQWIAIREGSVCEALPDESTAGQIAAISLCQNPDAKRVLRVDGASS